MRSKQLKQKNSAMLLIFFTTFHLRFFVTLVVPKENMGHEKRGFLQGCNGETAICDESVLAPNTLKSRFCFKQTVTGNIHTESAELCLI